MPETFPVILDGYTDLPPGRIANVVTFLELTQPPEKAIEVPGGFSVHPAVQPPIKGFRALYRRIGENWLWFSHLVMPDAELAALLAAPTTQILTVTRGDAEVGLAEIDFTVAGEAEIVTFGVVPEATGTGAAHALMAGTLAAAFRPGIGRVWLHTCTFDHPGAVRFYRRWGFTPYKLAIEVSEDPRATGALPVSAAPHVPFLGGRNSPTR
jgi:GNAT superfamily N-acetyltransferase